MINFRLRNTHFLLIVFLFFGWQTAFAQFGMVDTNAKLAFSPQFAEPKQNVNVSLEAYAMDTTGATITWYLNGIEQTEFKNLRNISFTTGSVGETVRVSVEVRMRNGQTLSLSESITPSRVDIIVEADTLVPLHYAGRALPSGGSQVRLIAITDTNLNPQNLTYRWNVNDTVLYGGSIVGKNVASFIAPRDRSVLVRVEIFDNNGKTIAKKLKEVVIATPELIFYELNPLRGISNNAVFNPHLLVGEEMTVRAEPYYMDKNILPSDLLTEWEINRDQINNPSQDKQEITLRPSGGTGNFTVNFHIRNLKNYLQGAEDSFVVGF
jgi:hypothetical protein